jgi:hypothetical protein
MEDKPIMDLAPEPEVVSVPEAGGDPEGDPEKVRIDGFTSSDNEGLFGEKNVAYDDDAGGHGNDIIKSSRHHFGRSTSKTASTKSRKQSISRNTSRKQSLVRNNSRSPKPTPARSISRQQSVTPSEIAGAVGAAYVARSISRSMSVKPDEVGENGGPDIELTLMGYKKIDEE